MIILIEIVVATFFTLLFAVEKEVKPEVAEKAKTEQVCRIFFSDEC